MDSRESRNGQVNSEKQGNTKKWENPEKRRNLKKREGGSLTVEACLVLTFFIFVIMLFLSFGRVFRAQNYVAHSMMQTTQAIAQDYYIYEQAEKGTKLGSGVSAMLDLLNAITDLAPLKEIKQMVQEKIGWDDKKADMSAMVFRRYAKLTMGDDIDSVLQELGVDGGLSGLEIEELTMDASGDVYAYVKYRVKLLFPYLGFEDVELEQKARAKVWK